MTALPNKRMQLTALQFEGTLDSVQTDQSPQLMRGPLGRRKAGSCSSQGLSRHSGISLKRSLCAGLVGLD
jgi:hypothetical protein